MSPRGLTPEEQMEILRSVARGEGEYTPVEYAGTPLGVREPEPEPERISVLGEKERDPYWETNRHPFNMADVFGRAVINAATAGNSQLAPMAEQYGEMTGWEKAVGAGGSGVGIGLTFGAGGPVIKYATGPVVSRLPQLLGAAVEGAVGFGAYEAAHPADSFVEQLGNTAKGAGMGAAMGPLAAYMRNPVTALAGNSGIMTALTKMQNPEMSLWDAAIEGVPFAFGMQAMHPSIKPDPVKAEAAPPRPEPVQAEMPPQAKPLRTGPVMESTRRSIPQEAFVSEGSLPPVEVKPEPVPKPEKIRGEASVMDPIEGVPVTVPMSRYLKGEITRQQYEREMSAVEGQTGSVTKEAVKAELESMKAEERQRKADGKGRKYPRDDKERARIAYARAQSRSVSPEVAKDIEAGLKDFTLSETVDFNRTIDEIVQNRRESAVKNNTKRLGEMSELVEDKLKVDLAREAREMLDEIGIRDGSPAEELMGRLKDEFEPRSETPERFMSRRGNRIVEEYGDSVTPEEVGRAVEGMTRLADMFAAHAASRDAVRQKFTASTFTPRSAYFPKIARKVSAIKSPLKRLMQETEPVVVRTTKESNRTPGRVISSREKMRSGSDMKYPREYRVSRVLEDYVNDLAKSIARQPVISSGKAISEYIKDSAYRDKKAARELRKEASKIEDADPVVADDLRAEADRLSSGIEGQLRTANAIDGIIQSNYNDIRFGQTGARMKAFSSNRPGMAAIRASRLYKRMFNMAKYKMNVPFIVLRQWTSSFQNFGAVPDVTPWDVLSAYTKAHAAMWRPGSHQRVLETYTGNRKAQRRGSIRNEATGDYDRPEIRRRTKAERALRRIDEVTDMPTNKMEEWTNRFSAEVADMLADKLNLDGRTRNEFKSDVISWTQSEYHRQGMSEIRKDPLFNALFPAQSYPLAVFNNIRFAKSAGQRARLIAGTIMSALVYQYATGYFRPGEEEELDNFMFELGVASLSSGLPYSSIVTGLGPGDGMSAPAGAIGAFGKAVSYVAKAANEDDEEKANLLYGRAAKEILGNFIPAGGQISRAVSADIMIRRGIIDDDDRAQAATLGWWTTPRGKEYLRRITGHGDGGDGGQVSGDGYGYGGGYDGGY